MHRSKLLIILSLFFVFSTTAQAQIEAIFAILGGLRGVGGETKLAYLPPYINEFELTNINSLNNIEIPIGLKYQTGITVYNPTERTLPIGKIHKELYTWKQEKWERTYAATPIGSLKEVMQDEKQLYPTFNQSIRYAIFHTRNYKK